MSLFAAFPWSYGTSNCRIRTPLKHLVEDEIQCVQSIDEHDQFVFELQTNLRSMWILKDRTSINAPPQLLQLPDYCTNAQNETNNCITVTIYHCIEAISMRTCTLDANSTVASIDFGAEYITNELSIQIHHNFTSIENFTVFFVYHGINGDGPGAHIVQTIRLEFLEMTETFATRDVHQVSGSIGYIAHNPLIVTKYVQHNHTTANNMEMVDWQLGYFHSDTNFTNDEHYMKLPTVRPNGDCQLDRYSYRTIDFGDNVRIKCKALLTPSSTNATSETTIGEIDTTSTQNSTHICRTFQRNIFDYLLHRFELANPNLTTYGRFNVLVSELGNPRNDSMHWFEFRTLDAPNLDDIVAIDAAGSNEFACTNMVLSVRYDFFYGTMMFGRTPNQALIKAAQIQFGNRVTLKFRNDDDDDDGFKVPLYMDVMFYDFSRVVGNNAQDLGIMHSLMCVMLAMVLMAS